jgi:hypothetical protein
VSNKGARVQRRAEQRKAKRIEQEQRKALKAESERLKKELANLPKARKLGKRPR